MATIEPSKDFTDPRLAADFSPKFWPRMNGSDAPSPRETCEDLHLRRCLEFLSAYYRINCCNAGLLAAREAGADHSLDDVTAATSLLDALDDRYAPVGFFSEPTEMDGVFYRDIKFVRPAVPTLAASASSDSSHIKVPDLDFIPSSELEGDITIERWT